MNALDHDSSSRPARVSGTSYKFQRLREEIRQAVASGELQGKLPGERILARRFKANAKTLSKALTDLAAEGVLDRMIGRGTFVKGTLVQPHEPGRWLLLTTPATAQSPLIDAISALNPNYQSIQDVAGLRPSFLGQFSAVIDLSSQATDAFLRDLTVRNMPVVLVNREPASLSLHAVLVDVALGGARLAREMLLSGHRRLLAVERQGSSVLGHAVRQVAARYTNDAIVETCAPEDFAALIDAQATGIICDSACSAAAVHEAATSAGMQIPEQLSLGAVGCGAAPVPASGYYVSPTELAGVIAGVLRDAQTARPAVLWLNGAWQDAGTISTPHGAPTLDRPNLSLRIGMAI